MHGTLDTEAKLDNIAWHYQPVQPSNIYIRVDLSNHGMSGRYEQLWATQLSAHIFQVNCIPFFAYGISLGDIVEADSEYTFLRTITKSGHSTMRIAVVAEERMQLINDELRDWLSREALLHEWYTDGYLAVDLPTSYVRANIDIIQTLIDAGDIQSEIIS